MKRQVLALAAALLVGGCAQVPTTGPVVPVDEVDQTVPDTSFVRALAQRPTDGMTQPEIVQGFLDAASGFDDGHAVAREYLTPAAAANWDPAARALVFQNGTLSLTQDGERVITVQATRTGLISPSADFNPSEPGSLLQTEFRLVQIDGQWRISNPPQGLLLSQTDMFRSFRTVSTYFIAQPSAVLAPNPLLLPNNRPDLPTTLVNSLLSGPSRWLAPAVRTGFPTGTRLSDGAVTVVDGVAEVDLTDEVVGTTQEQRTELSAQLVWTLKQVPGVTAVRVTAGGEPLVIDGVDPVQGRDSWPTFNPAGLAAGAPLYFTRNSRVLQFNGVDPATAVPGPAGLTGASVEWPVVSPVQPTLAATRFDGSLAFTQLLADSSWETSASETTTRGASLDRTGWLWTPVGDRLELVNLLAVILRTPPTPSPVRAIEVSRDGSRAIFVSGAGGQRSAYVVRIDRSSLPTPQAPRLLPVGSVRAAAWSGPDQVALLVKPAGEPAQIALVELADQQVRLLGGPPEAVSVAAAPGRPLVSGTADGRIWEYRGQTWVPVLAGEDPRYPG